MNIGTYHIESDVFYKHILRRDGSVTTSSIPACGTLDATPESFDKVWLKLRNRPKSSSRIKMNLVDLFCGTGPMTLGVIEAARCLGINMIPTMALDFNADAAANYKRNFPTSNVINGDITDYINGEFGNPMTPEETKLMNSVGKVDFLIAGPPCQGHSDLNNHTRRNDPRNQLILRATRFVEIANPKYVLIENVQGIRHDKHNVLDTAKKELSKLGYTLYENLLLASDYGVAQKRRRFILVASKIKLDFDIQKYKRTKVNSVLWAIDDLATSYKEDCTFNSSAKHSAINQKRIDYLFDNNMYELPNCLRPKCQQKADNRYTSVYGRMYPNKPAPTITSGFGSIGQGRFAHPLFRRSLTPHEAARVQFIPDYFTFDEHLTRVALQTMIGNAVPPKLTYILTLELLR